MAECELDFRIRTDTPYLALTGELWSVYCEDLGENWPRYNGTALYFLSNNFHSWFLTGNTPGCFLIWEQGLILLDILLRIFMLLYKKKTILPRMEQIRSYHDHSDKICSGINISNTFQMQDLLLKLIVLGKGSLEASSNNQHSIWKTISFAIPVPGWHWCQVILLAYAVVIKWKHFPHYWPFVRWIALIKASDTKLWCFLWSVPEETVE